MRWLLPLLVLVFVAADSEPTTQQQRWFNAFSQHPIAQARLAQQFWQDEDKSAALYWWQKAAAAGDSSALDALVRHFPTQRMQWLSVGAEQGDTESIRQLADQQLSLNSVTWSQWQQRWLQPQYRAALAPEFGFLESALGEPEQCAETINVIAASNTDKVRFVALLAALQEMPLPTAQWCFEWQLAATMQCQQNSDTKRAECLLGNHDTQQRNIVLANQGKASASQHQILVGDSSDSHVLAHELGHWFGLADEYAMSAPLAEAFCHDQYVFKPLNLVITETNRLTAQQLKSLWQQLPWREYVTDWRQLGEPAAGGDDNDWILGSSNGIGLYRAETCSAIEGRYAWKPTATTTIMQRHQTGHWPQLYLDLIKQRLAKD